MFFGSIFHTLKHVLSSCKRCTCQTLWCMTRRATPVLFAFTMGTGGISLLFLQFPYGRGSTPMLIFSQILFYLNLSTFICFFVLSIAKYSLFPATRLSLLRNSKISLFAACFPMGATTLISVAVKLFYTDLQFGGKNFLVFLWVMWWIDVGISFICCWGGVHLMISYQSHSLESMSATWLLPVVTLIVASSTGGILSSSLAEYNVKQALDTLTASVFMVAVGLCLATMILVIYLQRLITHGIPPGHSILSVFVPLGPTGQAGYSILLLGQGYRTLLPRATTTDSYLSSMDLAPTIINVFCICLSFILWSLVTMWMVFAFLALYTGLRRVSIPFRVTSWGLVFPNCVYAAHTIQLGDTMASKRLRGLGALWACGTLVLWICLFCRSVLVMKTFFRMPESDSISSFQPKTVPPNELSTNVYPNVDEFFNV